MNLVCRNLSIFLRKICQLKYCMTKHFASINFWVVAYTSIELPNPIQLDQKYVKISNIMKLWRKIWLCVCHCVGTLWEVQRCLEKGDLQENLDIQGKSSHFWWFRIKEVNVLLIKVLVSLPKRWIFTSLHFFKYSRFSLFCRLLTLCFLFFFCSLQP